MNKEKFLKMLNKNLYYLPKKERKEILEKYQNLNDYNLDPIKEANKIYKEKGLTFEIKNDISFLGAIQVLVDNLKSDNKEKIKDVLLFFLYLFFLLIIIKIPFIYVRDIISNMFSSWLYNNNLDGAWYFIFELLYAITTIIFFIKLIKNKAQNIDKKK